MGSWGTLRVDTVNKDVGRANEKTTTGEDKLDLTAIGQRAIRFSMAKEAEQNSSENQSSGYGWRGVSQGNEGSRVGHSKEWSWKEMESAQTRDGLMWDMDQNQMNLWLKDGKKLLDPNEDKSEDFYVDDQLSFWASV